MTIESYGLIEHFNYMCKYVPQPFYINGCDIVELKKDGDEYFIITQRSKYTLTKAAIKKLVDSLGVKIKLLSAVADEADVIDLVVPAVNKLLKCFAECFVFYATANEALTIIDLNVNSLPGEEGTKYEHGPSPWKIDVRKAPSLFTCFAEFMDKHAIENAAGSILVKAEDIMPSASQVSISLFKSVSESSRLQPMLVFNSKFSNMNGFSDIHTILYDIDSDIAITFPMNYAKDDDVGFERMWKKAIHLLETTDLDDYIFREINELAASSETPGSVKNFISNVLVENTLNVNQPIKDILTEVGTVASTMKPAQVRKFKKNLGALIGFSLIMKHSGCASCGHMDIH